MSNLFHQLRAANNSNIIKVPFDPACSPREQIETAIASVKSRVCERHPHEILPVDKTATIRSAIRHEYPYEDLHHQVEFTVIFERCQQCPHNLSDNDIEVERCAVGVVRFGNRDFSICDEMGRPLPTRSGSANLKADRSPREQFDEWLVSVAEFLCPFSNQALPRRDARMKPPFETWAVEPQFTGCLQCHLERLGITPDEAHACFKSFLVDPPDLQQHLDACRAFAAAPKGVLLLLGNCGTGKTHLAIAIMRELLRRGVYDLRFVKHRHFLAEHWRAQRPVSFGDEQPTSPLVQCQEAAVLVYDELTVAADSRSCEDVLLDLFEYRIGHFKPSVITANVSRTELEAALGTRLFDRFRRASFALLEFGFESKRPNFNADYLNRIDKP